MADKEKKETSEGELKSPPQQQSAANPNRATREAKLGYLAEDRKFQ